MRLMLPWLGLCVAIGVPLLVAAWSPLLAWRDPVYIIAGFAGIFAMGLLLVQPMLAARYLPGLKGRRGRQMHLWTGLMLVGCVLVHVGGLWLTSPPDVVDALLFVSATPFSAWGVIAMLALLAAGGLAVLRSKLGLAPRVWRLGHSLLVTVVVIGSVVHALLIEGTMGTVSKVVLCLLVIVALIKAFADLRAWKVLRRRKV